MPEKLVLISHRLCPYVQRAAIALAEKGVPFERVDIDLDAKPDWFLKLSPLGKVPVLKVGDRVIFESAVILEYLEDTQPKPLHPADPLARAEHRAWIEFGSSILADLWGFYTAPDAETFAAKTAALEAKFARLETRLGDGPSSTAPGSRWWTPSSARSSATSTSSMASPTSAFSRASRSSWPGARRSPRGRRSAPPSPPTTPTGSAASSAAGPRASRRCSPTPKRARCASSPEAPGDPLQKVVVGGVRDHDLGVMSPWGSIWTERSNARWSTVAPAARTILRTNK